MTFPLPHSLHSLLENSRLTEIQIGRSDARVYRVSQSGRTFYLKMRKASPHATFADEVAILRWLRGQLPVPEVLGYERDAEGEYLLLSEIAGENCVEAMNTLSPEKIVSLLAAGLKQIHAVSIENCPFDAGLNIKLQKARDNVENHLVDETDFDAERLGKTSAMEILQRLESTRPRIEQLVFTHGDYCLPNILLQGEKISGFIDWDCAGIADPYNDLAIASRSIRDNLGTRYEALFFEHYGLREVDTEKIAYYRLMDELF